MMIALALVSAICYFATPSHGAIISACPGQYPIGSEPIRGKFWYRCVSGGVLEMGGCLDPSGRRMQLGETYVENDYEMKCQIEKYKDRDYLRLLQSGCVNNGRTHNAGEQWNGKKFWYTCERRDEYIFITLSGCVFDDRRLQLNERAKRGNIIYECQKKSSGAIALCSIGCVHDGRDYFLGQQYQDELFKYECTTKGGWCHGAVIACLDDYGGEHRDGETWSSGDGHYRCEAKIEDTSDKAKTIVLGCVDQNNPSSPRQPSQRWEEGGRQVECRVSNQRAVKTFLGFV